MNQTTETEIDKWCNKDNHAFYENVPIEKLREFAIAGGFENGCDIDLIYPYIEQAQDLADVGAGYGRAISSILQKGYHGNITAIERSKNFYDYLTKYYSNNIKVICGDIDNVNFENSFDVVLFLWSNISEWNKKNQPAIIKKIFSWVRKNGHLIIDVFDAAQTPLNSTHSYGQYYKHDGPYGITVGYTPTIDEMKSYISMLAPEKFDLIHYKTSTNRSRSLFIITR